MKQNLLDFDAAGLTAWFAGMGEKPFRAKQVLRWLHQFGEDDFEQMSDVARSLPGRLAELAEVRASGAAELDCHGLQIGCGCRQW
jgi:23S rRNA (adenine2503-C2)-methyltransferase